MESSWGPVGPALGGGWKTRMKAETSELKEQGCHPPGEPDTERGRLKRHLQMFHRMWGAALKGRELPIAEI